MYVSVCVIYVDICICVYLMSYYYVLMTDILYSIRIVSFYESSSLVFVAIHIVKFHKNPSKVCVTCRCEFK